MNKKLSLGKTYNGIFTIPGLIIELICFIVIAFQFLGAFDLFFLILSLILYPIGYIFFVSKGGVEYDNENKRIRIYHSYFGIICGSWKDFKDYESINIGRTSETKNGFTRSGYHSMNYKTYDVYLKGKNVEDFLIKSYGDYEKSIELMLKMSELTELRAIDEIKLRRESSVKRRQQNNIR